MIFFSSAGLYAEKKHDEEDVIYTKIAGRASKKERIFKKPGQQIRPEIIRKDMILMNKVFNKVYGDAYKHFADSNFMEAFPDIDNFNSYYGDEADTYEASKGWHISVKIRNQAYLSYSHKGQSRE